ncbi:MAG: chorismate mutase, partial [Bifidobacterium castoris]|nr:chorismate mutase [Bifidobacterium castoris]
MRRLYYLGPEGTFTHQAALEASRLLAGTGAAGDIMLEPCADAASIVRAVGEGSGWGVVAWENNVEGYVVPNLDMLIDARDVA